MSELGSTKFETIKAYRKEATRLRAANAALVQALEVARHSLATLDGLSATDGFSAYSEALGEGADPNGAWDCFIEQTFKIDEVKALYMIDAALAHAKVHEEAR